MPKKTNSSIIANFFLKKAFEEKKSISPMKLIKLVYIAHGWCLATLNHDILDGEQVEAWKHGPIIPSLYHEFKRFSNQNVDTFSSDLLQEEESGFQTKSRFIEDINFSQKNELSDNIKDDIIVIIETVWNSYKDYSAWGLSQKTHESGSPWEQTQKSGVKTIDNEKIKKYYIDFFKKKLL